MKNIYFDLDDTLIQTQEAYMAINDKLSNLIEINTEYKKSDILKCMNKIDLSKIESMSFSPHRFSSSWVETFEKLMPINSFSETDVFDIANEVFHRKIPLHADAKCILEKMKSEKPKGAKFLIFTQGDKYIQTKRIEDLELGSLFDDIIIIDHKNEKAYRSLTSKNEDIMIGNSINHDILPALNVGWKAFHVERPLSWEYDSHFTDRNFFSSKNLISIWDHIF
ncbi:HAD family hydrolase [Staphylococcus pettenkoferi]|uniref:HAD family hydrolase n=1 Tax=Staphylococcus pettenkoferi TaxID=170573 RepID=UPI00066BB68D|nr:HAD family hydrolase [Staphylococcus pettenkoferi]MDK7114703.1 HAD family hydrolase [Staphylococcus pettenkoferi]MDK7283502.1 HAD family hydrolase [Staphylococcus pettenkoferi]